MPKLLVNITGLTIRASGRTLLDHIDLAIRQKEIISVIGPNGAGKTTLAKAILGIFPPQEGSVKVAPGLRIGYVPQRMQIGALLPLTVERFVGLAGADRKAASQALAEMEAGHVAKAEVHTLSGGEWQRVQLARAIVRKPQLLILDEAEQGMDIGAQAHFYELIGHIRDRLSCAILMVSHDLHMVMAATNHVICLNRHICCAGVPEDIRKDPAFVALFGKRAASSLALYHHHHDHSHD